MQNTVSNLPKPINEPIFSYAPGSKERQLLQNEIERLESQQIEIPLIIGGKEIKTGNMGECVQPHDHRGEGPIL
jgi:1-pyrroline-5-carboxylate dehydrogenase